MADTADTFSGWLAQAQVAQARLTPAQLALVQAVFRFRQRQGSDYYSTRLLSHFLLHCAGGLKVAAVARLLGLSRPTASRQQGLSSKEAIRQAHHRMDGRPYGKLLPRYAGPIAGFLFSHPDASRADLIDFIDTTFGVRVSRVALAKFLKKFGLDQVTRLTAAAPGPTALPAPDPGAADALPRPTLSAPQGQPAPTTAPPFSSRGRNTRAPSS
jgi:hypothetical protein